MLVSGGSDKNVRIWGLDFGDCHKSMFLFADKITSVKFIPDTHFFVAASKDKSIKHVDADKFVVISIVGHHYGEIWGLGINSVGDCIISVSSDRSIMVWKKDNEPVLPY